MQKKIKHYLYGFIGIFIFLLALLFYEYTALMHCRVKLHMLKKEYRLCLAEVKELLIDYHQTKRRLQQLETALEKKEYAYDVLDEVASSTSFDDGLKVFSSEQEDALESDSFVCINRDLEYLKQQSHDYIKRQNLELLFLQLPENVWLDYIDTALSKEPQEKAALAKKQHVKRRVMRSASSALTQKKSEDLFSWPISRSKFWLSSLFGKRKKVDGSWGFHTGIDMAAHKGTPVHAALEGIVTEVRNAKTGYGKTVVIKHNKKYRTRYAHLNAIYVKVGQKVERGAHIADVGDTGFVRKSGRDASHLHFELYVFGERVNPLYYLA